MLSWPVILNQVQGDTNGFEILALGLLIYPQF